VGFDYSGEIEIMFAYQLFWPDGVLQSVQDAKVSCLGNKTTTLEFLGDFNSIPCDPRKTKKIVHLLFNIESVHRS